ncbi:hypothetical protein [Niabella ginsengisoli]|uniref:DUF4142 domain-containing protein n=1 Tax=Niabella ginsengisoli TaxID=522298 RepID=A0ABS9SNX3_9BACT|nr:hypothetical protein [Niabella ginsengisoli]MCH5600069.1 hypothetical protein [Niabella ginsengisoli]
MRSIIKSILGLFIAIFAMLFTTKAQDGAGKQAFYNAMASNSTSVWNKQLEALKAMKGNDKAAYEGALLMRKSGSQKTPGQKLSMFKKGHGLLETAISKEPANIEYKFLRLMIQENAPKIVGYNKNVAEDAKLLKNGYKSLPAVVQNAIVAYSKSSKVLSGLQ